MIISKVDYMNRYTDAELAGIFTISKTNIAVEVWLKKFDAARDIDLNDPRTIAGVQAIEASGLLAAGRAAEILAIPRVRILAPFDSQWPDTYAVVSVEGSTYRTEVGDFDAQYVEVV